MSSTEPQSVYVDVDHNEYLAAGSRTVDAIVSVALRARAKDAAAGLALRVWTPAGATVEFLKQVAPTAVDLSDRRTDEGPLIGRYVLDADGGDRDFHLRVEVPPHDVGRERMAARVKVVADDVELAEGQVKVFWTTDVAHAARIDRRVAEYTGRTELAAAVDEGLSARERGDDAAAAASLERALALATAAGDRATSTLVESLVDLDAPDGTARLRRDPSTEDALDADRTARVRREP